MKKKTKPKNKRFQSLIFHSNTSSENFMRVIFSYKTTKVQVQRNISMLNQECS